MTRGSTDFRDDEDELLQYAYLPVNVKKLYAIRYRGYVVDLPHYFLRVVSSEHKHDRGFQKSIVVYPTRDSAKTCHKGDWIVGFHDGTFDVVVDDVFLSDYVKLLDLNRAG